MVQIPQSNLYTSFYLSISIFIFLSFYLYLYELYFFFMKYFILIYHFKSFTWSYSFTGFILCALFIVKNNCIYCTKLRQKKFFSFHIVGNFSEQGHFMWLSSSYYICAMFVDINLLHSGGCVPMLVIIHDLILHFVIFQISYLLCVSLYNFCKLYPNTVVKCQN